MAKSNWNLIDFSNLQPSHCLLPTKQRRALYTKYTQCFRISKNNKSIYGDITDNKFATELKPMPLLHEIIVFIAFYIMISLYFIPIIFIIASIYLLYHSEYTIFILISTIYLYLTFHPISLWREAYHNRLFYSFYNYFSYKFVYHSSIKDYISNHLLNNTDPKYSKPLIMIGVPHGILPFATSLSPVITKDILNKPTIGCMADIIGYLPILRNLVVWNGCIGASKANIMNALSKGYNIGIIPDGIGGMFTNQNDNAENILLKHRKGVAKLALQSGCSIVPVYGFGNTILYTPYFDKWGIMKYLSRKLKMSFIAFSGRYYGLTPRRIPLYCVMGKIIEHPADNIPVGNPTNLLIDQYHEEILRNLTELFEQHKGFYGWQDKCINFI